MSVNENELSRLMALADKYQLYGAAYTDSASSYNPVGRRFQWAMSQMGGQGGNGDSGGTQERMPNYFAQPQAYQPAQYQPPQQTNAQPQTAYGDGPAWRGGRYVGQGAPMGGGMPQPDGLQNYLARLLGTR